jgi:ADP-ribose pyrophosphatase YjhB (NUDIX family)
MNFCPNCGHRVDLLIPPDDDRPRHVCSECSRIHYVNPRLVVGCVIDWDDRILMCRRAIEPRHGLWTIPAGYLETNESVADGARREVLEEALADVEIIAPYILLNLTFVEQVYLMFRARLIDGRFGVGGESLETRLFDRSEIPWDELAFSAVRTTLEHYFEDRDNGHFPFHMGDVERGR